MGCGCGGRGNNSVRRTTAVQPGSTGLIRASTRQVQQGIQAQAQQASNRRAAVPQTNNQEASGMSQERREIEKRRRIQVSLRNRSRKINNPPN